MKKIHYGLFKELINISDIKDGFMLDEDNVAARIQEGKYIFDSNCELEEFKGFNAFDDGYVYDIEAEEMDRFNQHIYVYVKGKKQAVLVTSIKENVLLYNAILYIKLQRNKLTL